MWGPQKEAEGAPPALGKEAPHPPSPPKASGSERGDLFLCILVSFSIHKDVGGGFPAAACLARWGCQPVLRTATVGASQAVAQLRDSSRGPTSGMQRPLGWEHAVPLLSLILTQSPQKCHVLAFGFPECETGSERPSSWPKVTYQGHESQDLSLNPSTCCPSPQ